MRGTLAFAPPREKHFGAVFFEGSFQSLVFSRANRKKTTPQFSGLPQVHSAGVERNDAVESGNGEFLDGGAIPLKKTDAITRLAALHDHASDVFVVTDIDKRQSIRADKSRSRFVRNGLQGKLLAFAGERVWDEAHFEDLRRRGSFNTWSDFIV